MPKQATPGPVRAEPQPPPKTVEEDKNPFSKGKHVHHPTLGLGCIEKFFTLQGKERVMVQFESGPRLNLDIELSDLKPFAK